MWDSAMCLSPLGVLPVQSLVRRGSSPWSNPYAWFPPLSRVQPEWTRAHFSRNSGCKPTPTPYPPVSPAFRIPQPGVSVLTHEIPILPYTNKWCKGPQVKMLLISGGPCIGRYIGYLSGPELLNMQYVLISTQHWKVRERGRQDYYVSARYPQWVSNCKYIIYFDFPAPIQSNGINTLSIFLSFRHFVFVTLMKQVTFR